MKKLEMDEAEFEAEAKALERREKFMHVFEKICSTTGAIVIGFIIGASITALIIHIIGLF